MVSVQLVASRRWSAAVTGRRSMVDLGGRVLSTADVVLSVSRTFSRQRWRRALKPSERSPSGPCERRLALPPQPDPLPKLSVCSTRIRESFAVDGVTETATVEDRADNVDAEKGGGGGGGGGGSHTWPYFVRRSLSSPMPSTFRRSGSRQRPGSDIGDDVVDPARNQRQRQQSEDGLADGPGARGRSTTDSPSDFDVAGGEVTAVSGRGNVTVWSSSSRSAATRSPSSATALLRSVDDLLGRTSQICFRHEQLGSRVKQASSLLPGDLLEEAPADSPLTSTVAQLRGSDNDDKTLRVILHGISGSTAHRTHNYRNIPHTEEVLQDGGSATAMIPSGACAKHV